MGESESGAPVRVCSVDDLADGEATVTDVGGVTVAVVRFDGEVYALENVCPHQGGPVGEGKVEEGCIHCPWHGWQFDLETGEHTHGPTAVNTFPVTVDGDDVYVTV